MRLEPVRWSRQRILETQALLAEELRDVELRLGPDGVRAYLDHAVEALATNPDPEAQLRRFLFLLTLLSQHERHGWLTPPEVTRVADVAGAILKIQGISRQSSKLAWLHGDLDLVLSQIRRKEGRPWQAAWLAQNAVATGLGGSRDETHAALTTAGRALRLGNVTLALDAATRADTDPVARITRIQALRLAGRLSEAGDLARTTRVTDPSQSLELAWEDLCRIAQRSGDLTGMVNAVARGRSHRHPTYMLEATLWAKVVPSKQWLARVPRAETIRKLFPDAFRRGSHGSFFFECAAKLDRCYDNGIPLPHRLSEIGDLLEDTGRLLTFDKELLLFAAATRFLSRYHQPVLAAMVQSEYRARSLRASDGATPDVFGVAHASQAPAQADGTPKGAASRAATVTRLAAAVGGTMLKGKIKRLASPAADAERIKADEAEEVARLVVETLGKMRGPTAKIGQILSMAANRMPANVRHTMATLRDAMPPAPASDIRAIVQAEFGKPVEDLFTYWSDEPIASASIGQIHRATLPDGRDVVVKVQYSGIKEIAESDSALARLLQPVLLRLFPRTNIEELIEQSREFMIAECDYLKEAQSQTTVADFFKGDPEIVVPRVHPDYSTERVLTMDYVRGLRINDFVESATQEERNTAGRIIYRFGWESVLKHGFFNGDPHPGNFLFLPDGRVACLDFGFASPFSPTRRDQFRTLLRLFVEDDFAPFPKLFREMGYVVEGAPFDDRAAWEAGKANMTALRSKVPCRFDQRLVDQGIEKATYGFVNRAAIRLPLEDSMILRFSWCLQASLSELGAENLWVKILEPLLYGQEGRPLKRSS